MDEAKEAVTKSENETGSIAEVIAIMLTVDINSSEADLNATTISDGKGGRIQL